MILKCILKCITNNCKPPQILTSEKLSCPLGSFGSKSFHGFVILTQRQNGTDCLSPVLFGHEKGSSEYFCNKPYQTMPKAVKTFKKHQNTPKGTYKMNQILLYRQIFRWMHIVVYHLSVPPRFWRGEIKYQKNWLGGAIFKKICRGNQKGDGRENAKSIGRWDFFIFLFSYDGNWHRF